MPKIKLDLFRSYLAMIKNLAGTRMFKQTWFVVDGRARDITRDGEVSCAVVVSAILFHFGLIKSVHATVSGTIDDLRRSGWRQIKKARPGAVALWAPRKFSNGEIHEHVGFVLDSRTAVSNDYTQRRPIRHHLTYGPRGSRRYRRVVSYWWHPKLRT